MHNKTLINQSFFILLTKLIYPCTSIFLSILIARYLGPTSLGQFAIAGNIFSCFNILALMGIDIFVLKETSQNISSSESILKNALFVCSISSILCTGGMIGVVHILNYSNEIKYLVTILSLALFPMVICQVYESVFIAHQKQQFYFITFFIGNFFKVIIGYFCIVHRPDLSWLMWIITASMMLSLIGTIYVSHKKLFNLKKSFFDIKKWYSHKINFQTMKIFSFISIGMVIFTRIDIILISKIRGEIETGIYSIANKFIYLAYLLLIGITTAMYPRLNKHYKDSMQTFKKKYYQYKGIIFGVICFCSITIHLYSKSIIVFVYGQEYLEAMIPLKILLWSIFPMGFMLFYYNILLILNQQKAILKIISICLVISLPITIFLTYYWGYVGTSYGIITAYTLIAVCYFLCLHRKPNIFVLIKQKS
ncbi:hypothetical protein MNBD_GAMMA03-272 [hydrothermal vent metagenome]|uniref:Uncharacterized protein n=1 Tax=hydrothermal vent metagenome TaxID=652676 RepID=A0A3B0WJK7_9ZZZZ